MSFALLFYGTLVAVTVWTSRHDSDLRWVGWTLAAGFCLSNVLFFVVPIIAWPGPYTMIEVLVALASYCAWGILRYRALVVLVAINLASVGITVNFAAAGFEPSRYEILVFVVGTNICFTVECLLTLGVGIAHGYSTGYFRRRFSLPWRDAQPDAARQHKG